jgi:demethylmenaquinone methyltransferase / 2-methoxy-6-polyprenyl-1,4-benzoquinol methylase
MNLVYARFMNTEPTHREPSLPPHPPLRRYYSDEHARRTYLNHGFDVSARYYDGLSWIMSFGTDGPYRQRALVRAGLTAGMSMLDVGCGTGLSARAARSIVGPQGYIVGVEPSRGMLGEALRGERLHAGARGIAEALPIRDNQFDFLCMSFALRHVADLQQAFREFQRVLKPGGIFFVVEMTPPQASLAYWLLRFHLKYVVPLITRLWSGSQVAQDLYRYCWDSHDQCVPPDNILSAMQSVGLQDVKRWVEIGLFSEYTARKPRE